jgi:hypothetical protein
VDPQDGDLLSYDAVTGTWKNIESIFDPSNFVNIAGAQNITGAKVFQNALLALLGSNPIFRVATTDNEATVNFRNAASEDAAGVVMSTPNNEVALVTRVNNMNVRIQPHGTGAVRFPAVPAGSGFVRMMVLDTNDRLRDGGAPLVQTSGAFTPTLSAAGLSFTYTVQSGSWRRLGNLVFIYLRLVFSATGTPAGGALRVSGLPHTGMANEIQGLPILKFQNSGYTNTEVGLLSFEINGNVTFGDVVFKNSAFAPLTTYSTCGLTIQGSYITSN